MRGAQKLKLAEIIVTAQYLVSRYGNAVGKIKATKRGAHGDAHGAVAVAFDHIGIESFRFLPEHEKSVGRIFDVAETFIRFRRKIEKFFGAEPVRQFVESRDAVTQHLIPIIPPRAFYARLG